MCYWHFEHVACDYNWKQWFSQTGDVKFSNTKVSVCDAQLSHGCIAWWHIVQSSPAFLTLLRINSLRNLSLSLLHFYHPARFTKNLSMCNFSDKDENVMSSCYVNVLFVWHFFIFFHPLSTICFDVVAHYIQNDEFRLLEFQ